MNASIRFRPQTPGAAHPRRLASSHKLGRPVGLAVRLSRTEPLQAVSVGGAV